MRDDGNVSQQILQALPADAASIGSVASQLVTLALERAAAHHAEEVSGLQGALAERDAVAADAEARVTAIERERYALAQDLQDAHEEAERLAGEKTALADSVRALGDKVRKLEGFKQLLVSNLAEENGGALPRGFAADPLPDGDALLSDILANATPAALPARPSLVHMESQRRRESGAGAQRPSAAGTARTLSNTGSAGAGAPRSSLGLQPRLATSGNASSYRAIGAQHGAANNGANGRALGADYQTNGASAAAAPAAANGERVDGKDFFKLARSRLPYERFHEFLQIIKDLNAGKQSREATLEQARRIFGADNADLEAPFQGLLMRHLKPS